MYIFICISQKHSLSLLCQDEVVIAATISTSQTGGGKTTE
jgi:hypothetical protein